MEADNVFLLVVEGSLFTIRGHFVDIKRKKPSKLLITLGFMWWSWGESNPRLDMVFKRLRNHSALSVTFLVFS